MYGYEELNAKINRLKNGGGMGYSDTKTLCYDGKQMGTDVLEDGNLYVKVSADPLNLDGFQSVTLSSKSGGSLSYGKSQVAIGTEDGITAVAIDHLTYLLAFVVADENVGIEVGTYFYSGEDTYVSAIKTETIHPISDKYLPEGFGGGGLPVIDFGTLETESENNFIAPVDPSLFKDYMCFVGKFTAGGDNGKSTVHMVFSCIDGMAWTGYIHTHPAFGNMEMFGIIMVNGAMSAMQITMVPGTGLSE